MNTMNDHSLVGVALTKCYFCLKGDKIAINTRLTPESARRVEQMHNHVIDMDPCNECREFMKQGVILITIDDEKSEKDWHKPAQGQIPNPWRTGGWFVVKDEFCRKAFQPEAMADWAIKHRFMFIEHKAAEMMGLFEQAEKSAE